VLERRKVAAMVAASAEVFDAQSARAEAALEADLRRALVATLDAAFIDAANAGVADEMPASITNGVTPIASTGDPTQDLRALLAGFAGDLTVASFVTDPVTAGSISLWQDDKGALCFPDCGPAGGSLLGLPVVTSRAVPRDASPASGMIALVDGSGIAVSLEGMDVALSKASTLEMTDVPAGEADGPTPVSATTVSLFQADIVALAMTMFANWSVVRPGSVAVVTDVNYG
jgi:HK97 family phage major capsid protein